MDGSGVNEGDLLDFPERGSERGEEGETEDIWRACYIQWMDDCHLCTGANFPMIAG